MNRRLLLAVGASTLIIAGSLPAVTFAAGPNPPSRRIDVSKIDPSFNPLIGSANKQVTVMLELSGQAVLQAGGSKAQQTSRANGLKVAQAAVSKAVAKTGGKVTGTYRFVYNGIRVRTTGAKLADLAAIPGVVAVKAIPKYLPSNTAGVPAIGGPAAWGTSGATGSGIQIAVIDTGIDYTHATFGGEGTPAAFAGNDPATIEPLSFPTEKVIDGYDFAGNAYDANDDVAPNYPNPDPDPLDCYGHGSHVAGTAAGYGVKADHTTFAGPWDASTIGDGSGFVVGPGVAPQADLIALKVFGCDGSTDLVVDALDWVAEYNAFFDNPIDVVNMSLGAPFGMNSDVDSVATNALVASGVTVVASAGNESAVPYITGAPAAATKAISVAALDLSRPTFPGATFVAGTTTVTGIDANNGTLPVTGPIKVLFDAPGELSLGCAAGDYTGVTAGDIVVTLRGDCARTDRAVLGQAAGAAAVIMINNGPDLPPYEGAIPGVTIPFIGVLMADAPAIVDADGSSITLAATTVANPGYRKAAGFSSSGPRYGDSWLKADVAAPGVSVLSTKVGSGWDGEMMSGTSMAAPMTAGAAALVIQKHPTWTPLKVKAALGNTADGATVIGYTPLRAGAGKIRVDRAAAANVVATTSDGTASLSYGYVQANGAWAAAKKITITNDGGSRATYRLASSSSTVTLSATSVIVPAHGSVTVTATARLSATQTAAQCGADPWMLKGCQSLYTRSGVVTATPVSARVGQYALRVPFLVVPRGVSNVVATRGTTWTTSSGKTSGRLVLTNTGNHAGYADVYAWGVSDVAGDGTSGTDVRAAGVQSLSSHFIDPDEDWLDPLTDRSLVFAVNMYDMASSFTPHQVDIAIDTNADKTADFHLLTYDEGLFYTGAFNGYTISFITNANYAILDSWYSDTPLNGSTVLVTAAASDFGLVAGSGSFSYRVTSYNGFTGWPDGTGWSKAFDAFAPKISNGRLQLVARKSATSIPVTFYRAAAPRGWMVVTMDDRNGASQADLVGLP